MIMLNEKRSTPAVELPSDSYRGHPPIVDRLTAAIDAFRARTSHAALFPPVPRVIAAPPDLAEVAAILRTFYDEGVTVSSVQPLLRLAERLNPDLLTEPAELFGEGRR
jgi:hypothetical protein